MKSLQYQLFADYFQFYIQDEAANGDLSDSWDAEATNRLLAVAPGAVGIGTVRNMNVPVTLEIHTEPPAHDIEAWDHVTECGLSIASGRLVIAGCTDYFPDAARIDLPKGDYQVRVSYGDLAKLSDDGLDGEDHYRVQLWPGPALSPKTVKQRR